MAQLSLEAIQKKHEELLSKSAEMSETDISQVLAFLDILANAGTYTEDTNQRSLLRALIRYWAGFVDDKTRSLPVVRLQPFVMSETKKKTKENADHELSNVLFLAPPRLPYDLIGRNDLLQYLKEQLFTGDSVALFGLPGVGKTALALALSHNQDVLNHFPDGVLWASLGPKPDVFAYLGVWAAALGIPQAEIATLKNIEARAKAIHDTIGVRSMLLAIDDAWETDSALAFKVGGPNCAHLLTTRLPEVAESFAGDGTTVVHELSEKDGLRLLAQFVPEVIENAPDIAQELVQAVGGLPLALTLMGNYLRMQARGGQPRRIRAALDRLRNAEERLRLEQPQAPMERSPTWRPDMPLSLNAMISMSYHYLDEQAQQALQALSVFPPKPNTFSEEAALAVSGSSVDTLDILVDSGLLESSRRYTLHQTIADYARIKLTDTTAYKRLIDFFVRYVEIHTTDLNMLDQETNNVLAALHIAYEQQMMEALLRGVNAFFHFMETRGLYTQAEIHLNRAQEAARSLGDAVGLATALLNLGRIVQRQGEYEQAEEYLQEGLKLARKIEHRELTSALLSSLGELTAFREEYPRAETYLQEGLALARQTGNLELISLLLGNLGGVAVNREDYQQAEVYLQEGLALTRQTGHRERASLLLGNLGVVAANRGDYERAEMYWREGLELARQIGHREMISTLLQNLGTAALKQGNLTTAETYWQEGLKLAYQAGDYKRASNLLQRLGVVAVTYGEYEQANRYLQDGLDLARQNEDLENSSSILCVQGELSLQQKQFDVAFNIFSETLTLVQGIDSQELKGIALFGLARVAAAQGNNEEAHRIGEQSLSLFERIGYSAAAEVRQWLATLSLNQEEKF